MDPSEYYEYENRAYVNPTLSRDEQLSFVDTLRNMVDQNTSQINTQTQRLGTDITSNYGGLTGSNNYFKQRYQTIPMEAQVNTLKATAQAKALNDLMTNYQNQAANKYNQAYRNARARAAAATDTKEGDTNKNDVDPKYKTTGMTLNTDDWKDYNESNITGYMSDDGYEYWTNMDTGKMLKTNDPNWAQGSDGYYYKIGNDYRDLSYWGQRLSLAPMFTPTLINLIEGTNLSRSARVDLIEENARRRAADRVAAGQ